MKTRLSAVMSSSVMCGALMCGALMCSSIAPAASPANSPWTGVWQAKLEGMPAVELTLADDAGEVNGTVVFHIVLKEKGATTPHLGSTEPHTMIHPHLDGDTLSFQVVRGNGSHQVLDMSVKKLADGNMDFHCSNCSATGTQAELDKVKY